MVNYQSYRTYDQISITTDNFVTVYNFPTYTPKLDNSLVIHKFNLSFTGYHNGNNDARGRLWFYVNGVRVIKDQEFGAYDYGGGGAWFKGTYSNGHIYTNTDGADVPAYIALSSISGVLKYNHNNAGSLTTSFFEIMEIAQ